MIQIKECSKRFQDICAVNQVSLEIREREVFGLVGSNGAGKSTLLRILAGILKPDQGEASADGMQIYDHAEAKRRIFYIPDDSYFPANHTPQEMETYYLNYYPDFCRQKFARLMKQFRLDPALRIGTMSKGMKKQLMVILGVCSGTKYLLCDETFDGLDPVMRQAVKSLFVSEITNRDFTPVIASHNLRELEDICDHIGLIHKGGILLSKNLEDMKQQIHKIQCVFRDNSQAKVMEHELDILNIRHQGSLLMITARGTRTEIMERIQQKRPLFCEVLPLTLEEIFICETEVAGYEIKNIFF